MSENLSSKSSIRLTINTRLRGYLLPILLRMLRGEMGKYGTIRKLAIKFLSEVQDQQEINTIFTTYPTIKHKMFFYALGQRIQQQINTIFTTYPTIKNEKSFNALGQLIARKGWPPPDFGTALMILKEETGRYDTVRDVAITFLSTEVQDQQEIKTIFKTYITITNKKSRDALGQLIVRQAWEPLDFETALPILTDEKYIEVRELAITFIDKKPQERKRLFTTYLTIKDEHVFATLGQLIAEQAWPPPNFDTALEILKEETGKYDMVLDVAITFLSTEVQDQPRIKTIFRTYLSVTNQQSRDALGQLIARKEWPPPDFDTALKILTDKKYDKVRALAITFIGKNHQEMKRLFTAYFKADGEVFVTLGQLIAEQAWPPPDFDTALMILEEETGKHDTVGQVAINFLEKVKDQDREQIGRIFTTYLDLKNEKSFDALGRLIAKKKWLPPDFKTALAILTDKKYDEVRALASTTFSNKYPQQISTLFMRYRTLKNKESSEALRQLIARKKWRPSDFDDALKVLKKKRGKYDMDRECAVTLLSTVQDQEQIDRIFTTYLDLENKKSLAMLEQLIGNKKEWFPSNPNTALMILKNKKYEASFTLTPQSWENLREKDIPGNIIEGLQPLENKEFTSKEEFLNTVKEQIGGEQTSKYEEQILEHTNYNKVRERAIAFFNKNQQEMKHVLTTYLTVEDEEVFTTLGQLIVEQGWRPLDFAMALKILTNKKYAMLRERAIAFFDDNPQEIKKIFTAYFKADEEVFSTLEQLIVKQGWSPPDFETALEILTDKKYDEVRALAITTFSNKYPQQISTLFMRYRTLKNKESSEALGQLIVEKKWRSSDFDEALKVLKKKTGKYDMDRECAITLLSTVQDQDKNRISMLFKEYLTLKNKESFDALGQLIARKKWLPPDFDTVLEILKEETGKYDTVRHVAITFLSTEVQDQDQKQIDRIFTMYLDLENDKSLAALEQLIDKKKKWLPSNSNTALMILKNKKYNKVRERAIVFFNKNQKEIDKIFDDYSIAKRENNIVKQDELRPILVKQNWLPSQLDERIALLSETNVSILKRVKDDLKKFENDHVTINHLCQTFMHTREQGLGQFIMERKWFPNEAGEAFVMELLLHETFGGKDASSLIDIVSEELKAVLERYKNLPVEFKKRLLAILQEDFSSDELFCKLIRRETEVEIFKEMCERLDSLKCREALFKRALNLKGFTGALIVKYLTEQNWSPSLSHEKAAFESWLDIIKRFKDRYEEGLNDPEKSVIEKSMLARSLINLNETVSLENVATNSDHIWLSGLIQDQAWFNSIQPNQEASELERALTLWTKIRLEDKTAIAEGIQQLKDVKQDFAKKIIWTALKEKNTLLDEIKLERYFQEAQTESLKQKYYGLLLGFTKDWRREWQTRGSAQSLRKAFFRRLSELGMEADLRFFSEIKGLSLEELECILQGYERLKVPGGEMYAKKILANSSYEAIKHQTLVTLCVCNPKETIREQEITRITDWMEKGNSAEKEAGIVCLGYIGNFEDIEWIVHSEDHGNEKQQLNKLDAVERILSRKKELNPNHFDALEALLDDVKTDNSNSSFRLELEFLLESALMVGKESYTGIAIISA